MSFFTILRDAFPTLKLMERECLADHTSFRIGGPAPMAFPSDCKELTSLYRFCLARGVRPLILGCGTNVLAPDRGLERLVICTRELTRTEEIENGILRAECGVTLTRLACYARDLSLTGLEFAHGIPGSVGGGVYMNAGAYGGEMAQVVVRTEALLPDGSLWLAEGEDHAFSYRHSVFEEKQAVVLWSELQLKKGDSAAITQTMQELIQKRRTSQPLELPSAGSTFKRPAVGYAAALIDQAGLKGKGVGGAAVSTKHAGFVVNLGGATAEDVLSTMGLIQKTVQEQSGILLEPEVRIW